VKLVALVTRSDRFVAAASSAKMTPGRGGPIANVMTTGRAGRYTPLPGCVAVTVISPGEPVDVTVLLERVAGPESRTSVTGRPLVAVTVTAKGGVRTVTLPGGVYTIDCVRRGVKWATTDLFEVIRTLTNGLVPEASPVQPTNAFPALAVAIAVARALAG
jgi:hypothetical protein